MKFASVSELKNKTSEILRMSENEDIVVTINGKPRAIIKGVSEKEFEDYLIENNPKFLKTLESSGAEFLKKGGNSVKDYMKKRKKRPG